MRLSAMLLLGHTDEIYTYGAQFVVFFIVAHVLHGRAHHCTMALFAEAGQHL